MASHQLKVIINSTLNVGAASARLKAQIRVAMTQYDAMGNMRHVTLVSDKPPAMTSQRLQPMYSDVRTTQTK